MIQDSSDRIDALVETFRNIIVPEQNGEVARETAKGKPEFPSNTERSWGFESHFHELLRLESMNRGKIFPFLAVDPRRVGILDLVKRYVSPQGPFYGIKLYPRLGYKITINSPFFNELFSFCTQNDLPITSHGSIGGMPPPLGGFNPWPYDNYGHPNEWIPVLDRFTNLRLDIAHFGGKEGVETYNTPKWKDSWTLALLKILQNSNYPNVYSDLSCFSEPNDVSLSQKILNDPAYSSALPKVLFGTDNPVVFLTNPGKVTYQTYFESFRKYFSGSQIDSLMIANPVKFLKPPRSND